MNFTAFLPVASERARLYIYQPNDESFEADNYLQYEQDLEGQEIYRHIIDGQDNLVEIHGVNDDVVVACNEGAINWALFANGKGLVERGIEEPVLHGRIIAGGKPESRSFFLGGGKRLLLSPAGLD